MSARPPGRGTGSRPRAARGAPAPFPASPGRRHGQPTAVLPEELSHTSAAQKLFAADESQPHRRLSLRGVIPSPLLQSSAKGQILCSKISRWEILSRDFHKDYRFLSGLVLFKS